jgi:hypothetical protein
MRFNAFFSKYTPFPNFIAFFITGFCFGWICFIAGVWLNQFGRTPVVERAINSSYAIVYEMYNQFLKPNSYASKNNYWLPERYTQKGVVQHQADQFAGDSTLVLSAHHQGAELFDQQGGLNHQWHFAYEDILKQAGTSIQAEFLYWWQARVFPNGDLLAIVTVDNRTPAGLALIKLDKDSNLIWQYQAHVHHDFDVDEQGNIYLLEQGIQKAAPEHLSFLAEPYINEWLTIIDAQGQLKRKINIYDAISSSPYKKSLRRIAKSITGDYLHPNSVKVISAKQVSHAPYLQSNSVLIDIRELDAILTINLNSESVNWMIHGPWYRQHDPDLLENGNLLIFDNLSLDKQSRVIEFDPRTQKVVWEYKGTNELPLYSVIRGGQQQLSNGNVLIYESNGSRVLEVDRQGELVWEYYSTHRAQDSGSDINYAPVIMSAHRYEKTELPFLDK